MRTMTYGTLTTALLLLFAIAALLAPTSAMAARSTVNGPLTSICVDAKTKLMSTKSARACRASKGRFISLQSPGQLKLCVRFRGLQHLVFGTSRGTLRCGRSDRAVIVTGATARRMCVSRTGILRFRG